MEIGWHNVSICIPVFNGAHFLEAALQSALKQTYPVLEILVSDDGSTDESTTIVQKYQQANPLIRLVKNENKGMVNNWNNCIAQAKGDWVKFLFQDDLLEPSCVEALLKACVQNNVAAGFCNRTFIFQEDVPKFHRHHIRYRMIMPERLFGRQRSYISPELLATELAEVLPENAIGEPSCYLFHKSLAKEAGAFNVEYKQAVDLEFILRLGLVKGLAFVVEPLVQFRVHGQSETSANLNQDKEAQIRHTAAITGDTILLYHHFLNNPAFALIKEAAGAEVLKMHIRYLYYAGCKRKGKKTMNKALDKIRKNYKDIGALHYNILKYAHYRKLFLQWERQNRM